MIITNRAFKLLILGAITLSSSSYTSASTIRKPNDDVTMRRRLDQEEDPSSDMEEDTATATTTEVEESNNNNSEDSIDERMSGIPSERECAYEQASNEIQFECKSKVENAEMEIEDELKFKVEATRGNRLKVKVEYESETEIEATDTETETETEYTIVYDRLLEYRKAEGSSNSYYEWGVDEVVAEWTMDTWEDFTPLVEQDNTLSFSVSDTMSTFDFTIAQSDSAQITANKMKIDFTLENYPWDASGDTFIALISYIETEQTVETEIDGDETVADILIDFADATTAIGFVPFGEYTWASTAEATRMMDSVEIEEGSTVEPIDQSAINVERQVDGDNSTNPEFINARTTTVSVIASYNPDGPTPSADDVGTENEIAFSFVGAAQGAQRIYWDPEAGVGYQESSVSSASSTSKFVAFFAFGMTAFVGFFVY